MIIEIASGKHKLVIDSIAGGRAIEWFVDDLQILGPKGDHPLIGGFVIAVIDNGLGLIGLASGLNLAITGGVLLLAATADAITSRKSRTS